MKRVFLHLLIFLAASASAYARDTIVFKNGDVLTGTVLQQDGEHVHFKTESFGSVTLNTPDIAEIHSGTTDPEEVEVSADSIELPPESETTAQATKTPKPTAPPQVPNQWSGQAGLAIAMREKSLSKSGGVNRTEKYETYRLYGNVNWQGEKNNLDWKWTYRYSQDETKIRDDYLNITQKYNRDFKSGYYAEAKTVYQRDYNRRIDNEYLQTAEIGIRWIDKPSKLEFSTSLGGGYHQYERDSISTSQPKFIFDESLRWQMVSSLTLFQKYTHLGNLEEYHFVFTSGLENKLIRDIFLRMEYRFDRDTETSYDGVAYNDKALLASLLYKF